MLPTVLPFFNQRRPCEADNAALAYVLKVDEAVARPLIQRDLAMTRPKNCPMLTGIGLQASAFLEGLAVSRINDTWYLSSHGSPAAEQYLLARYQEWARNANPSPEELNFGRGLIDALARGQAWLYDAAKLRSFAENAVSSGFLTMRPSRAPAAHILSGHRVKTYHGNDLSFNSGGKSRSCCLIVWVAPTGAAD